MCRARRVRTAAASCLAAAAVALVALAAAAGAPAPVPAETVSAVRTAASEAGVSLIASSTSVPTDGTFGYTGSVMLTAPADFVQARLQVRRPTGRLLFQRTSSARDVPAGMYTASFQRELSDLDLKPGAYPVTLEVRVDRDTVSETTVKGTLFVYDASGQPTPLALVVRVTGQPPSDPSGRMVVDPAEDTQARDDVSAVSRWVIRDERVRISLAIAPLLLEEWRRIAEGYEVIEAGGVREVAAEEAVPRAYADALEDLTSAVETGRLELLSVPYADPRPLALENAGLGKDLVQQFDLGLSATFAALEATPSPGVSFSDSCITPATAGLLSNFDAAYAITNAYCVRTGDATPTSGAWRTSVWPRIALVTDPEAEAALASRSVDALLGRTFKRQVSRLSTEPVIATLRVGSDGSLDAAGVERIGNAVLAAPWMRMQTAGEAAASPRARAVTLRPEHAADGAPADYWTEVADARSWARSFISATGPNDPEAAAAVRASLVAEASCWSSPAGTWALADRGRAYASTAQRESEAVVGEVGIGAQDVQLASSTGDVPLTIVNGSDKQLEVIVRSRSLGGVKVLGENLIRTKLRPGDNFLEVPIDLQSSISGSLQLEVLAGPRVLATDTVTVRASTLNRLVTIAFIGLLLLAMLAYIIRRVRRAEQAGRGKSVTAGTGIAPDSSDEHGSGAYTEAQEPSEESGAE